MNGARMVALDLDGTLIDSMPGMQRLAQMVGMKPHDYQDTSGRPFAEQLAILNPEGEAPGTNAIRVAMFESAKAELYETVEPFPGTFEALREIGLNSFLVVASSTTAELTAHILERTGLAAELDFIGLGPKRYIVSGCEMFYGDSLHDGDLAAEVGCSFQLVGRGGLAAHVLGS